MKRITAVLLVLIMLLSLLLSGCGCSKKPATEPTEASTAPTEATTPPATLPPQEANRHPLTGEKLAEPWSGQIVAVKVNNIRDAMPQHGVSQADVVYEIEEEGTTRNMALYSDISKVDKIGSIRSTRTYFVSVAAAYDAYLVHCGTSSHAENGGYDANGNKVSNWKDIDEQKNANAQYFYRDKDRNNAGYAWEHTLFTSGERLAKALEGKDLSVPKTGFVFKEGVELTGGETANEITIKFKTSGKTTTFIYDAETGLYTRNQYGKECIDGNNQQVDAVKNVLTLYTKQWYCPQGHGHHYYDTIGSGEGYAAVNGKIVPIKWSRASVDAPYIYTLADGSPLELDVGRSYISIVGEKFPIEYK